MAMKRKEKEDYRVCEFCKMNPCMYVLKGEVEYRTHCRSYSADTRKIANDKGKRRAFAF